MPARFAVAIASASADDVVAHTDSATRSTASDNAMTPEPVPRSTAVRAPISSATPQRVLDDHLGLRTAGSAPVDRHERRASGSPIGRARTATAHHGAALDHPLVRRERADAGADVVEEQDELGAPRVRSPPRRCTAPPCDHRGGRSPRRRAVASYGRQPTDSERRRVCSSCTSPSEISSSSPARTRSSLYSVTLMR